MSAVSPSPWTAGQEKQPRSGALILTNLAIGHGIIHWYNHSMLVILPIVQEALHFSNVQFGALAAARQISSGVATIPGGFVADMARNQWGLVLTSCLIVCALSFVLLAFSSNYATVVVVMVMISSPSSVWHMPAIAAISQRFPKRRGFGLSVHGTGANIGQFIGPVLAGAFLTFMAWEHVSLLFVLPALLMSAVVWWFVRDLGTRDAAPTEATPLVERVRGLGRLLRNRIVLSLMFTILLRQMGFTSLLVWMPKYLQDPVAQGGLDMSKWMVGLNFALLTGLGVVSGPFLGILSDRYGRKAVLAPSMGISAVLIGAIAQVGDGLFLTLTLLLIGIFAYALAQIFQAALLDQIDRGTEGASLGLILGSNSAFAAIAPMAVAFVVDSYGLSSIFYFLSAVIGVATITLVLTPLRHSAPTSTPAQVRPA